MLKWIKANEQLLVLGVIIGFLVCWHFYTDRLSEKPQNYTIGVVEDFAKPPKGALYVEFNYKIDGKEYHESLPISDKQKRPVIGDTFLVRFPVNYESWAVLLLDYPIPDTLKLTMGTIWEQIPSRVKRLNQETDSFE
ncbi:hypothetical protein [Roseivirga pacifica]|uniref:hypothetical protein n=1 Tax=Roseivirga pacifica TaxID=1267423 RepID=UPI003BAF910E